VCDSGVDLDHPDLAAALVSGYNAVDQMAQADGGTVDGLTDHGTQVAGTAAALGNNGVGVSGVGWSLSIMPIRVSNQPNDTALISDINDGARWAAEHGARVINASFSNVQSASVQTTGAYVKSLGSLYVWSAGNAASPLGFFDHPDVIIVSATDQADGLAVFSNYGRAVDVAAPGVDILTTDLGGYGTISGTSFSAPMTAGVLGLIWSVNPLLPPRAVEVILAITGDDLGEVGEDDVYGHGRINAATAAQLALDAATMPLPPVAFDDEALTLDGDATDIQVLANDADLNGDPIDITSFDQTTPGGGAVELVEVPENEPILRYTPEAGSEGFDSFQYTIEDPGGLPDTAVVTVVSAQAPDLAPPVEIDIAGSGSGSLLETGDLDGDGDLDLIADFVTPTQTLALLENLGGGQFAVLGSVGLGTSGHRIDVGDLNDDGCADVAFVEDFADRLGILHGNCDGTFQDPLELAFVWPADVLASDESGQPLDFNGDGLADLVLAQNGFQNHLVSILLNDGAGGFVVAGQHETLDPPEVLAAGDLNGDAVPDVVVGGAGFGFVTVLLTDGAGDYLPGTGQDTSAGGGIDDLTVVDADGDGDLDVVTVSAVVVPGSRILLNDGAGGLSLHALVATTGEFPRGVVAADLDVDGDLDLVTANMLTNDLSVHPGLEPGAVMPISAQLPTVTGPVDVIAADFDLDGDPDVATLLLTTITPGVRRVLLFENLSDPAPANPADINGDGIVDVLDLVAVILAWGQPGGPEDVNGDGTVDVLDLIAVITSWGSD
jgi:hypothetical protein